MLFYIYVIWNLLVMIYFIFFNVVKLEYCMVENNKYRIFKRNNWWYRSFELLVYFLVVCNN